jgi:hypothetical protein
MSPVRKPPVFAPAAAGLINPNDAIQDPASLKDAAYIAVRHHFDKASGGRMSDD